MRGPSVQPRSDALVLSLHPRFAEAIVAGTKTVEVRRSFGSRWPGASALIYATSPVRAVVGVARIERVERLRVADLWRRYSSAIGISRAELDAYLVGRDDAFAIALSGVEPIEPAVTLASLRAIDPAVRAPRSYASVAPGSAWEVALGAAADEAARRAG